jgi:DegV family protein with EDD domain
MRKDRDYKIVADSSCDLNEDLEKNLNISLVPFKIDIDHDSFIDDAKLDLPKMVGAMKKSSNPIKTSCPSPGDFLEEYKKNKDIFAVTISSKLSGTYNSAVLARDMAKDEDQDKFVHVFDSKSASVGETLVAIKVSELIKEKLSNTQIVEKVEKYISEMKTYFISESLDNLIKNGRISRTKGLIANVLKLKPIMGANDSGEIFLVENARGTKRAFNRLLEIIGEGRENFEDKVLAISHANALEKAMDLKEKLKKYNFKDIVIVETKGLSTGYVNDGGIILAY